MKTKLFLFGFVFLLTFAHSAETVKIGVLAKNGPTQAFQMWKASADYLTASIPGQTFEIVPLSFEEVNKSIKNKNVDFVLANSSMFVTAKVLFGIEEVATMINSRQGISLESFGGVVFTTVDMDEITDFESLKGMSFAAVKESSFGGWQMAYKEFVDVGINPFEDFASMEYLNSHDNVVFAVQNGMVDAGTVRTDTLERMVSRGEIYMDEFKIIHKLDHEGFPFVCSSALYPEWPLAKLKDTSSDLSKQVVEALKTLKSTDKAAKNAKIIGWTDPLDYEGVENLQKSLKIGAYAE